VYQEFQVTYMHNNEWKLPLNLAVGIHALLVLVAIYMPGLFHTKPIIPEIYTVNLINIADSGPQAGGGPKQEATKQEPAQKKAETAKPEVKIKPVEIKKPAPPPEPVIKPNVAPVPVAPPVPDNAISLKPLNRKIEKEVVDDSLINERIRKLELQQKRVQEAEQKRVQEVERKKDLENIRKQRIAEATRAVREAEDARNAAAELKELLHSASSVKNTAKESTSSQSGDGEGSGEGTNARSGDNTSGAEKLYQAAIFKRLQQFWALPEFKKWDPSLTAIVVITINQEGAITNQFFEKRSGDKVFDQFVEKTLRDSVPLPPIPAALRKSQYEIGLRFKPTGIQ
jgi:colicin import membrane protein